MSYKYCTNGEKVLLTVDEDFIAVRFREPAPHSIRESVAKQAKVQSFASRIEVPGEKFTIFNIAETSTSQPHNIHYKATVDAMNAASEVARVAPIFKVGSNHTLVTDRLIIGFKPQTKNASEAFQKYDCKILERNGEKYLVCLGESEDPLEVTSQLEALQEVNYVKPSLVNFSMPMTGSRCIIVITSAGYGRLICF